MTKTILAHPKTEVDAVSKDGHTALILAAMSGNYKVCKAIIQAGADATIHSSIDLIAAADAGDVKNGDADPSGAEAAGATATPRRPRRSSCPASPTRPRARTGSGSR